MSIHSMTGHGRGEAACQGAKIIAEAHSLNHRQSDLRLDLPPLIAFMENEVRRIIRVAVARGSITCRFHLDAVDVSHQKVEFDRHLARDYYRAAYLLARELNLKNDLGIKSLLNLPGIVKLARADIAGPKLRNAVLVALHLALKSLKTMRAEEGRVLAHEIGRRMKRIENMLQKIKVRIPAVKLQYKNKMRKILASVAEELIVDKKACREIVALAEKYQIDEEIERLGSHLQQFRRCLSNNGPVGRTLDFIVQEMMREINTISSKANDCLIANIVVKFKSELESIREQVQNIE